MRPTAPSSFLGPCTPNPPKERPMKERVLGVVVAICLLFAGAARAQTLAPPPPPAAGLGPNGFGAAGQVAIASDFGISFIHFSDAEFSELDLEPALDYFIAPNLSVGGK